jgi:hypothetical protein
VTAFVEPERLVAVDQALRAMRGVRRVITSPRTADGLVGISAHVDDPGADDVIETLSSLGIDDRTAVLSRQLNPMSLAGTVFAAARGTWTYLGRRRIGPYVLGPRAGRIGRR